METRVTRGLHADANMPPCGLKDERFLLKASGFLPYPKLGRGDGPDDFK